MVLKTQNARTVWRNSGGNGPNTNPGFTLLISTKSNQLVTRLAKLTKNCIRIMNGFNFFQQLFPIFKTDWYSMKKKYRGKSVTKVTQIKIKVTRWMQKGKWESPRSADIKPFRLKRGLWKKMRYIFEYYGKTRNICLSIGKLFHFQTYHRKSILRQGCIG